MKKAALKSYDIDAHCRRRQRHYERRGGINEECRQEFTRSLYKSSGLSSFERIRGFTGDAMSEDLNKVASDFIDGILSADRFCDEFAKLWKQERDDGRLLLDSPAESESLSTIFCLADLYNPKPGREAYELDEKQLRSKIKDTLGR